MEIEFEANANMETDLMRIATHPVRKVEWPDMRKALANYDATILVTDVRADRQVPLALHDILAVEAEDRVCNVKTRSGAMYLLNMRLKGFEEKNPHVHLMRINNGVMINLQAIQGFRASQNARLEVTLTDGSVYFVNRYYIKQFKEKFL